MQYIFLFLVLINCFIHMYFFIYFDYIVILDYIITILFWLDKKLRYHLLPHHLIDSSNNYRILVLVALQIFARLFIVEKYSN